MMWPAWKHEQERLFQALSDHSAHVRPLPGVAANAAREALSLQMVASLRRLAYTQIRKQRPIAPERADPNHELFDPELAAVLHHRDGNDDEAAWLIFLSVHFGKHGKWGWQRLRDVYSGLGEGRWTWARVSADPGAFRDWLERRESDVGGAFGNHRKYESLGAYNAAGTGNVVATYVEWVGPSRSHRVKFAELIHSGGNDPHSIFDAFYRSFNVARFGRLGRFDLLALIGRLDFAPIEPGIAYLNGATGPIKGARLLFGNNREAKISWKTLDNYVVELGHSLGVGMQVLEDSLCNWQKSPNNFIHFKG